MVCDMRESIFPISVHKKRQKKLLELMTVDQCLILYASPERLRNNDSHYAYRQDSNFFYLTGFEEPGAVFVLSPGFEEQALLFVRKKDPLMEQWNGFRFGVEGAQDAFSIGKCFAIEDFVKETASRIKGCKHLYVTQFQERSNDERLSSLIQRVYALRGRLGLGHFTMEDAYGLLSEMRLFKDAEEVEAMRTSARIGVAAHIRLMKAMRPGISERTLHGIFLKEIMERGARTESYGSIMASGENATCLHYDFNDQICSDGDIFLVDAGAEYKYYASDITRSYPVSGTFTAVQKEIYQTILEVQKNAIASIKPGSSIQGLNAMVRRPLVEFLISHKILSGSVEENIEKKLYTSYLPHGVSHWLGLDVHDVGSYGVDQDRKMAAGMCLTVEPGMYFTRVLQNLPQGFISVGMRIEDDVLVTEGGCENLTVGAPKEVEELEALISH